MSTAKEWKVRFRSCGIHWADHERVTDYTALWDHIPWDDRLTERVTDDEASARAQYETLRAWERDRSQPVRDVELARHRAADRAGVAGGRVMSADVWVEYPSCEHCGRPEGTGAEVNITYNLSPMLHEAGFVGWRDLAAMSARDAGRHVLAVLNGMRNDLSGHAGDDGDVDDEACGAAREHDMAATSGRDDDDARSLSSPHG